jgi:hypothetical protein
MDELDLANLHHAYLVIGSKEFAESSLHSLFSGGNISLVGSPDYFVYKEALFGIDEARELSVTAGRRAFVDKKVFFIAPERITLEAQNALLKTFEEPAPSTHFFLVVRDEALVLPTLRSRMQAIVLERSGADESEAKKFLKLSLKERLNFARKFADADLPAGRQGQSLSIFLDELLIILKESGSMEALKEVYPLRLVSDDRSASARLILEHLSLVI